MSEERMLETEEVADLLRINPRTVIKLVRRGELRAYDVAGKYRFRREDVDAYLKNKQIKPSTDGS